MAIPTAIQRLWDECWNERKFDVIHEIFTEDFTLHAFGNTAQGREVVQQVLRDTVASCEDIKQFIDECFEQGNIVSVVWNAKGTYNNKALQCQGITIFRMEDGLIKEAWLSSDEAPQKASLEG